MGKYCERKSYVCNLWYRSLYISTFCHLLPAQVTAMKQSFNKEIMVLLLLGLCCIKTTFAWRGYSQIPISRLLTLRPQTLHIPRYWPPSGQLTVVILQIGLEAALSPLTTWSVADRRAPTLLVLQLGWWKQDLVQGGSTMLWAGICVNVPRCNNGDWWPSGLQKI